MNDATILGASAIVALLALVTAAIAWVSKIRSDRHHRLALDEATRTRDKQIQSLEQQIDFLRQLEAVKFVERYIATRRGLQQRLDRLAADVEAGHAREREIEREIRELSRSDEERDSDVQRLRAELSRNQQEAHRLEQAIDAVFSIGEIQVDDVRREVARRRRMAVELKGRIERLGLDAEAKVAEIARLKAELDSGRDAMEGLRRELDLTRSAGPIVDGLLGIDEELADKVDDIDHHLSQAGLDLGANADAEMVGHFLAVVERERSQRGRLLGAGSGAEGAAGAAAGTAAGAAAGVGARGEQDRARAGVGGHGELGERPEAGVPPALAEAVARARADAEGDAAARAGGGRDVARAGADTARAGGAPDDTGDELDGLEEDPWDAVTSGAGNGARRETSGASAERHAASHAEAGSGSPEESGADGPGESPRESRRESARESATESRPDGRPESRPGGRPESRPEPRAEPRPERRPVPVPGPVIAETQPEEEDRPDAEPPEPRVWY